MTKKCRRCGKRIYGRYKEYCKACYAWINKQEKKRRKERLKEIKDTIITLRLRKGGRYVEHEMPHRMLHSLFDLQYMMHADDWDTLKLNKMDKEISEFFSIIEQLCDADGEGRTYGWDYKIHGWKASKKHHFYLGGKRPRWKEL